MDRKTGLGFWRERTSSKHRPSTSPYPLSVAPLTSLPAGLAQYYLWRSLRKDRRVLLRRDGDCLADALRGASCLLPRDELRDSDCFLLPLGTQQSHQNVTKVVSIALHSNDITKMTHQFVTVKSAFRFMFWFCLQKLRTCHFISGYLPMTKACAMPCWGYPLLQVTRCKSWGFLHAKLCL